MPKGKVTIRVWLPRRASLDAKKSVGHISLQTHRGGIDGNGFYISMYPKKKASLFHPRHSQKLVGPNKDMLDHPATSYDKKEIDLYSLDVEEINAAFENFKKSNYDWSFWGSSFLASKETQNCCGLVYLLMKVGGAHHLEPRKDLLLANLLTNGILGSIILSYTEEDILNSVRVLNQALFFAVYIRYAVEKNKEKSDAFMLSFKPVTNTFKCAISTFLIGLCSANIDYNESGLAQLKRASRGGLLGFIIGASLMYTFKYLAERHFLVIRKELFNCMQLKIPRC